MAAVAAALRQEGCLVTGSDQDVYPPMSTFLAAHNIPVMPGYAEANLNHRPDLVVIGNAVSRGNPEAEAVLANKLRYCSLPELLKEQFLRGKRVVVVAGTHGKTTTTALLAWVFEHNGLNPGFLVGGLAHNLGCGARFTDSPWFVIEGDEYDTAFFDKRSKFVHYLPEIAVLNNLEFDHADIFDNLEAVRKAFTHFIRLIPRNGLLLANGDDSNLAPLLDVRYSPVRRFGLGEGNDLRATDLALHPTRSTFQVAPSGVIPCASFSPIDPPSAIGHPPSSALPSPSASFTVPLIGELNVRNALAVVACARHCGLTDPQIQSAFDTFTGIKRRMELRGIAGDVTVIDDFGHHPTAIRETLRALRVRFPGQRLWAVFEPRSNTTRRNVFQRELAEALLLADAVVLAQVARLDQLRPGERLDPMQLMAVLRASGKPAAYLPTVEAIVAHVGRAARAGDVVCVFSNGGFGAIHERLLRQLYQG
jgi:UDP-N-acetylmuramate: L-alanyl-gamma-D-glutamyl-meso-diaminopimelate ligase